MLDQQKQAVEQTVRDVRLQAAGCKLQGLAIRFKRTSEVAKCMGEKDAAGTGRGGSASPRHANPYLETVARRNPRGEMQ